MDLFDDSESKSDSESESDSEFEILLPGTEIPKSLKFNHQIFGNSISFKVGCKFPKLAVCVAFRSAEAHIFGRQFRVQVSVNGCMQIFKSRYQIDSCEELWLFSKSMEECHIHNVSEQNQVIESFDPSQTTLLKV